MATVLCGTTFDIEQYKNLYQLFEESSVTSSKGNNLMEIGGSTCTYDELSQKVHLLSVKFHNIGLKKGSKVGLLIPNGIKRIVALLALIKTGIIFTPLDSVLSPEQTDFIIRRSEAEMVITTENLVGEVTTKSVPTFSIDDALLNNTSSPSLHTPITDTEQLSTDDVMCVLFTSGSAGRPKGIKLTHRNFINRLLWYYDTFPYEANEVLCSKTNMLFVDFYTETLAAVLKQMSLVLLNQHQCRDVAQFIKILKDQEITRLVLVPSLLKCLNTNASSHSHELSLKHIVCSGEELSYEVAKQFVLKFPHVSLYNFYGSTEVTGDVLYTKFNLDAVSKKGYSVIGHPIYNTNVYIETAHDSEERIGELCVTGYNVADGYIEQQNEHFVTKPHDSEGKFSKIFKTGDFVRADDFGLEYIGRQDDFVKVRGHKVHLKSIEEILKQHMPAAEICVLSKFSQASSETQIYAFIVSDTTIIDSSILKAQLPSHMTPQVIPVKRMPLTQASGKVDRQVLLELVKEQNTLIEAKPDEFDNAICKEEKIRRVACKVLGINADDLDVTKGFFQLGGNSLTAVAYIQELHKLGIHCKFEDLIHQKTLLHISSESGKHSMDATNENIKLLSFHEISKDEVKFIAVKLDEIVASNGPLSRHTGYPNSFLNVVTQCKRNYPTYGTVAKIGDDVVGAVINSPMNVLRPFGPPDHDEIIVELLSECQRDVLERLMRNKHNILYFDLIYVDVALPRNIAADVFYKLTTEVISIARKNNHTAIVTSDTNPSTILLDKDLGFVSENIMYPKEFCYKGEFPFSSMDANYKISTNVKYL